MLNQTFDRDGNLLHEEEVPDEPIPPSTEGRIVALESRLDAVAALAEKANATAQEVAAAAKPTR